MDSSPVIASASVYADSADSSPRSRGGESWDEPYSAPAAPSSRFRVMCSYGGRILPRPTGKYLCYSGGETRMVVIDRRASLADLSAKLSRDLLGGASFSLKYQLPNEDLDSLISVSTDEDLENMIDELDRISASSSGGGGSTRSGRLRLFLFSSKPDSGTSSAIGSLIDESKSETWFVDALNSAISGLGIEDTPRGSTDSASVNCLVGLDDDSSAHLRGAGGLQLDSERPVLHRPDSSGKLGRHGQEVISVPSSPMLDKASSFGSTSSPPPFSNLPPIPAPAVDRAADQRVAGVEDHFSSTIHRFDSRHHHHPPPIPLLVASAAAPPTENVNREFSDDDTSDHGGFPKPPQPTPNDGITTDPASRGMYSNPNFDPKVPSDPSYLVPSDPSAYVMPSLQPEKLQQRQSHLLLHQQPPQFSPAHAYYIHHPAAGPVLPMPPYYHIMGQPMQLTPPAHAFDPQIPFYYTPYNLAAVQPNLTDSGKPSAPVQGASAMPPEVPPSFYRTAATTSAAAAAAAVSALQQQLMHVTASQSHPYAATGYQVMQHPQLAQPPATMANYGYDNAHSHPPMHYSQAALQMAMPQPYQTVSATAAVPEGAATIDSYTSKVP